MKFLELVEQLFAQYGYWVLLIGLPLDTIALPIPPGNTALTYTGYLSYKGVLKPLPAMAVAYAGACLGMTITYWIGYKLGTPLVERYGKWLFFKPELLEKTRRSYGKYGNKIVFISYFVPGIRQFIGYFVGMIRIPYRSFALYAYTGAGLWVSAFFGIGYIFGEQWEIVYTMVEQYLMYTFMGLCVVLTGFFLLKWSIRLKTRSDKFKQGAE
ncbi:DedA family protein [Paenactinomyces guangxiensis]|uniref:DedA family protein n=1 Tax=Paenactinomyces guangxiensis TaxID=1490290 RepID=A0A7W1WS48_9BACL|nr:DedA family protein [Paenactinomyces guangxiensis]MBA4494846.1 DedA family protein [Paenactinomyces guangxiensis]MBH8591929.1 DedA family protein [Paenactinomyces guangxiensis]